MNDPQIQFARTSDGVSIAYASVGEGPCVIAVPSAPQTHVELQPHLMLGLYTGLTERFHAVWLDARGSGLSDRNAVDFSRAAMVRDLEAVVQRIGEPAFALFAVYDAVPVAITYAAEHPERVTHLVLGDGRVKVTDYFENATISAEVALRNLDWNLYTETFARVLLGTEDPDYAAKLAEHLRACVEPETLRKVYAAQTETEFDVPDGMLETIAAPTLVVHNRKNKFLSVQSSQRIAAAIPNASFQMIDDMVYACIPAMIAEFMGSDDAPTTTIPAGTAVILFADIADSTALTEQMGDAAFREKARGLDTVLRSIIRENDGRPVEGKLLGDGVLAVFISARQAIDAAVGCSKAADEAGLPLHLGVHAGDVIRETDPDGRANVYGGAVNIAARITADSTPGEVLVSETVRSLGRTSASVRFEDRGSRSLKGVGEPVRVWAVRIDS